MNTQGKYVIGEIQDGISSFVVAVCFPEHIGHNTVARKLFSQEVIAGGFFSIDHEGSVRVYGASTSTGSKSRPGEDERLICQALGLEC
ncbi:hypothetical protein P5704_027865 (plasmid) [Pseudomonas sp. FeN3W]|nr:hypothetical protein P5704_027865 [Pseudomonas sp. FeN3W]